MPLTASEQPKIFYGYIIALAGFLALATMWGAVHGFGVFLKSISEEFGWTRAMISGSYSTFILVVGLLSMLTGRLTDRFGPRVVLTVCGLLLGSGFLMMSQITALWQLYLLYGVIIATGISGGFVPMTTTVARWFVKKRGMMTGIVLSGIGVAVMTGPPVARWLISIYGWRDSYFIIGITALVLLTFIAQFLQRDPEKVGQSPYGAGETKQENVAPLAGEFSFLRAISTRQFWMVFTTNLCWGIIINSIMVHTVPNATDLGISAINAANILAIMGAVNTGCRVVMSGVADKIGSKSTFIIGFCMLFIALLSLQTAKELWMFYLFAVVFGVGQGIVGVMIPLTASELFGVNTQGIILGTITFAWAIGGLIGPLLAGYIFDITYSYHLAFGVLAFMSAFGLLLVLLLKPLAGRA